MINPVILETTNRGRTRHQFRHPNRCRREKVPPVLSVLCRALVAVLLILRPKVERFKKTNKIKVYLEAILLLLCTLRVNHTVQMFHSKTQIGRATAVSVHLALLARETFSRLTARDSKTCEVKHDPLRNGG